MHWASAVGNGGIGADESNQQMTSSAELSFLRASTSNWCPGSPVILNFHNKTTKRHKNIADGDDEFKKIKYASLGDEHKLE